MKLTVKEARILFFTDMHFPFCHRDTLSFLKEVQDVYKCNTFVDGGDLLDCYALSDFDHDPDAMNSDTEFGKAARMLAPLFKLFPEVLSCEGNHTERPERRRKRAGLPNILTRPWNSVIGAPVGWHFDLNHQINNVMYEHGHAFGSGAGKTACVELPARNGMSTVFGHFHSLATTSWVATKSTLLFGHCGGCLVDIKSYAMQYGAKFKYRPVVGATVIINNIPTFIPMVLSANHGRWIGKL